MRYRQRGETTGAQHKRNKKERRKEGAKDLIPIQKKNLNRNTAKITRAKVKVSKLRSNEEHHSALPKIEIQGYKHLGCALTELWKSLAIKY